VELYARRLHGDAGEEGRPEGLDGAFAGASVTVAAAVIVGALAFAAGACRRLLQTRARRPEGQLQADKSDSR